MIFAKFFSPNFDHLGALEIRGMKNCDFYCKRHILAWIHVFWANFAWRSVGGGSSLQGWAGKVRKSRWAPINTVLNYRDRPIILLLMVC